MRWRENARLQRERERERLHRWRITGINKCDICFSSHDGIGSRTDDVVRQVAKMAQTTRSHARMLFWVLTNSKLKFNFSKFSQNQNVDMVSGKDNAFTLVRCFVCVICATMWFYNKNDVITLPADCVCLWCPQQQRWQRVNKYSY